MINPPITKDDIKKKTHFLRNDGLTVTIVRHSQDSTGDYFRCNSHWWYLPDGQIAGYGQHDYRSLRCRLINTELAHHQIRTTHPSDSSGVAFLSRHFEQKDTITEEQALLYGIGRLSARVFDLNKWYAEQGMNRRIVCVKKQITKKNGRKAYVTDYYKLGVV